MGPEVISEMACSDQFSMHLERRCYKIACLSAYQFDIQSLGKKFEALLGIGTFEAENPFDLILIHDDVADAIHYSILVAAKAHPQFMCQAVHSLIHPVHIKDTEDVPVPYVGGLVSKSVLDKIEGLEHSVIGGPKADMILKKVRPDSLGDQMVWIRAVHEGIKS